MLSLGGVASVQAEAIDSVNASKSASGPQLRYFNQLDRAGLLLLDDQAASLESKSPQRFFIPASTTKLLTALLALRHWGDDYRFKTAFYLTDVKTDNSASASVAHQKPPMLLVKGYGDPFLVSEELAVIARQLAKRLKQQGISSLAGIQLDTSYYHDGLALPGAGLSDNPYDAIPSALAANFNTVFFRKSQQGAESAEPQTPMTATALTVARRTHGFHEKPLGAEQRVNLGTDASYCQRYFAELLRAFLKQEGVSVAEPIVWQTLSAFQSMSQPFYVHENSKILAEIVRPMMKYSTNFVANQLALNLSAEVMGGAASEAKVLQAYRQLLTELFGWKQFHIEEGAGLSRHNRLSPTQLIDVLSAFKPWRHLLPEIEPDVFAKSGSLLGVSALAGYIQNESKWYPFAFMINQKVPYHYRNRLIKELSQRY